MQNTEIQKTLSNILSEAGELIMSQRMNFGSVSEKEKNEIVTSTDIDANNFITSKLTQSFPEIPIYTEEGTENKSSDTTRWIVDPIDGTTPWVWGNSGFSISIALEQNEQIVLAAVYDPVMKELFFAEQGKGATRNGEQIDVAKNIQVKDMLMVVDWGNKDEKRIEGLKYFEKFFIPEMFARRIVPQWAPALGLCHLAEGRIHALVCNDTWVEDHAAGALIVEEAGGYVTNFYNSDKFTHRESGIIATIDQVTHSKILEVLS